MRIRPARAEDHEIFARFFVELGVPDAMPDPERWAAELMPGAFFVEEDGQPAAYGVVFPRGEAGHVLHVVVGPEHRGRGLGKVVMAEAARRLRAAGCRRWFLNVRDDNPSAIALYRSVGMRLAYRASSLRLGDDVVRALPVPDGVVVSVLDDEQARAAEKRYSLVPGSANRLPGLGLGAFRAGVLCGVARFVEALARSAPFKVDEAGVVRPLLDEMRARLPEKSTVKVVLEDQPDVIAWLLKLGAVEELSLLHLTGDLPP
jgi:ribosomal protein S18 acetylase RimI-like enzyme